ncbi:MAG: hypothetical protein PHS94_02365 [Erysipelotrichaceae bacterium]|nr:hypothetical protein [Erysipelotrichaceae bacterium]
MKTKIKRYFKVQSEIERYGYSFSMRRFYQVVAFSIILIVVIGITFNLSRGYLACVILVMVASLPQIITVTYRGLDSQQRFADLNNYLEQLVMSFKRRGNLITALQETRQIFAPGAMAVILDRAIGHINEANGSEAYRQGLGMIEEKYGCSRIRKVHDFLYDVEKLGGDYGSVLNLIDQERLLWQERVYLVAAGKKQIEKTIYLSCVMATIIAAVMGLILPDELNVFALDYLQLLTAGYLVAIIVIVTVVHSLLSGGYFEELRVLDQHEYEKYVRLHSQRGLLNRNDIISLFIVAVGLLLLAVGRQVVAAGILAMVFVLIIIKIGGRKKRCQRVLQSNLSIAFMYWLLDISLLLQNNNIHMAIKQSIEKAPAMLQNDLKKLVDDLEKSPNSITPYQNFLGGFDLPDVKSVMRSFYALDRNGSGSNGKFLNDLLERNNHLVDKTEKLALENRLAYINVLQYLPMLLATFKLLGDLTGFMMVLIIKMKGG